MFGSAIETVNSIVNGVCPNTADAVTNNVTKQVMIWILLFISNLLKDAALFPKLFIKRNNIVIELYSKTGNRRKYSHGCKLYRI